jgi:hypothetical protein
MSCLDDIRSGNTIIVGIKDHPVYKNSLSGLNVDDHPGLNLKMFSGMVDAVTESGWQMVIDKISLAAKLVFDEFKTFMNPLFTINATVMTAIAGIYNDLYNTATTNDNGVVIRRYPSRLAKIFISEISLWCQNTGTYTYYIADGGTITPYTIDLIGGEEQIVIINKMFKNQQVRIYWNDPTLITRAGHINYDNLNEYLMVYGINGNNEDQYMYGINPTISLICDEDELICPVINRLYTPIWRRAGIEVLKEKISSDRINPVTLFGKTWAIDTLPVWQAEFDSTFKVVQQSLRSYHSQYTDLCLTCNSDSYVQSTP